MKTLRTTREKMVKLVLTTKLREMVHLQREKTPQTLQMKLHLRATMKLHLRAPMITLKMGPQMEAMISQQKNSQSITMKTLMKMERLKMVMKKMERMAMVTMMKQTAEKMAKLTTVETLVKVKQKAVTQVVIMKIPNIFLSMGLHSSSQLSFQALSS
jgi:hypothetical protein